MRVMQVMAGGEHGGAESIFLESVLALHEGGVEQFVVTRANNAFRLSEFARHGIPVATASFNKLWRWPTRNTVTRAILNFSPDVIEYWMGRAGTFAPAAQRSRNVAWYGGYYKIERFRNCAFHIGLTQDLERHILAQGASASQVGIVHTYADFGEAKPFSRGELDTPEGVPLLLALARLHKKKGLDVLLSAMEHLPDAYLWIAGEGPLRMELEAQARTLGLEGRTRFLGWRDDRGALLAACDIVAFPSRYEPFGTVTIDAWAAGRPIVAAKAQGPKATITHERDGMLVEIDDVEGLAHAIRRLIDDPELRSRLVAAGDEAYRRHYSKQAFIQSSLDFYRRVKTSANGTAE